MTRPLQRPIYSTTSTKKTTRRELKRVDLGYNCMLLFLAYRGEWIQDKVLQSCLPAWKLFERQFTSGMTPQPRLWVFGLCKEDNKLTISQTDFINVEIEKRLNSITGSWEWKKQNNCIFNCIKSHFF